MNAIDIKNLSKIYVTKTGETMALDDISFSIKKGELFGLLGPNGAGKSTLIHLIGGIVKKTSGELSIMGTSIDKDHTAGKMKLGIVAQEISFDAFLTIEQALRLEFGYYGMKVDETRVREVLEILSLTDKAKSDPRWLSGGMKRRFMIARALVHDPEILILDEPTAGVDVELRHDMYRLIQKLHASGKTIILTTHYLEEVELLAQRVAIMRKGKLVALDNKRDLKNRFQSTREFVISLVKPLASIPEILKPYRPAQTGTELVLTFEESDYKQVLAAVSKAELELAHFSIVEPSLEDVFMQLTNDKEPSSI